MPKACTTTFPFPYLSSTCFVAHFCLAGFFVPLLLPGAYPGGDDLTHINALSHHRFGMIEVVWSRLGPFWSLPYLALPCRCPTLVVGVCMQGLREGGLG